MNSKEFEYLGIKKWHEAGYKGQGITIASRESATSTHGSKVLDVIKQIVPAARILVKQEYQKEVDKNIDIYTTSLLKKSDEYPQNIEKSKKLYDNNVFLCCAIGNDGEETESKLSRQSHWQSVGACQLINNKVKRLYYSNISERLDFMSFTNINLAEQNGYFTGSSCATPVFASMCALVQCYFKQKYGKKLTNQELLEFIKKNCMDLEEEGFDCKTGHGLFILPKIEAEDMKKIILKIGSKIAVVNGKEVEMDVAPFVKDNRTFVPVRFVSDILGHNVEWDGEDREVMIEK